MGNAHDDVFFYPLISYSHFATIFLCVGFEDIFLFI